MTSPSLLALTRALATDDETKSAFRDDPEGFLDARGHGDLDPVQLATALEHVADALPPPLAAALSTVGDTGSDLADLLAGVAGIDPDDAEARWAEVHDPIGNDDDPLDGLDDRDDAAKDTDVFGEDPADLDDQPGGFDRAGDPDESSLEDDEPGGFDPATDDDTTFGGGRGAEAPHAGAGSDGGDPDPERPDDPPASGRDDQPAWAPEPDDAGGLDLDGGFGPDDGGDDEPGGFDRAGDPD